MLKKEYQEHNVLEQFVVAQNNKNDTHALFKYHCLSGNECKYTCIRISSLR